MSFICTKTYKIVSKAITIISIDEENDKKKARQPSLFDVLSVIISVE